MVPGNKNRFFSRITIAASCAIMMNGFSSIAAELRENVSVEASIVTLSDIFTDVGEAGNTMIMPAPAPGKRKQITSYELSQIAQKFELEWERPAYLKRIYVVREGTHISASDLKPTILENIRAQGVEADLKINVYGLNKGLYLPIGYGAESIEFETFNLSNRQDRFTGTLKVPTNEHATQKVRVSGTVQEVRLVPVLNRLITPGEVINETDITWKKHPANRINLHAITNANHLVGQTVKRALAAGKLLNKNDVAMPVMIEKGSAVSITLQSGLMKLTMKGRALDDGGRGDVIRVMNTKSNRSLEARVISPGKVVVDPRATITVASR